MIQMKLKDKDFLIIRDYFKQLAESWKEVGHEIAEEWGEVVQSEAVRLAPVGALAALRSSITHTTKFEGSPVTTIRSLVFSDLVYAEVQELGRRPGKWPPWGGKNSSLQLWVKRVLGVSGKKVKSVAYLVARKLFEKGSKGHKYFERAGKKGDRALVQIGRRAMDRWISRSS